MAARIKVEWKRRSLTLVQKGFILQRLLASCTARPKFFISMFSSARWHSSLPEGGTVDHREAASASGSQGFVLGLA